MKMIGKNNIKHLRTLVLVSRHTIGAAYYNYDNDAFLVLASLLWRYGGGVRNIKYHTQIVRDVFFNASVRVKIVEGGRKTMRIEGRLLPCVDQLFYRIAARMPWLSGFEDAGYEGGERSFEDFKDESR